MFHPHVPRKAKEYVNAVLDSKFIGQGPKVDEFEKAFADKFKPNGVPIAVNSGTAALHLAYLLAGIKPGDEVLCPLFTCTATNIPLLHIGAKPIFVDVDLNTLNVSVDDMARKINGKTKAIVVMHYGGDPCDMDAIQDMAEEYRIPVIEDAAHALGASYKGRLVGQMSPYTMFSFQAIKHLTTGDGGMLIVPPEQADKAKRLRWFGIDRVGKQNGTWDNDIDELGYKYQMTDISAAIGLAGLEEIDETLSLRHELWMRYWQNFFYSKQMVMPFCSVKQEYQLDDAAYGYWLMTVKVDRRKALEAKLKAHGIQCAQNHYRNDRYTVFGGPVKPGQYPGMDSVENDYLVLPLHTKMSFADVDYICEVINSGW